MAETRLDMRPEHWQIVQDILRQHAPRYEVWAFGSRVKGKAKQHSDLDLAIISTS
jgi:predicted nucleotidyltransferase